LEPAADAKTNLQKLDDGQLDLYPLDRTIGRYTIKKMGLKNVAVYADLLYTKDYPNVFSKKSTFHTDKYADITALMHAYEAELAKYKKVDAFAFTFLKYQ